MGNYPQNLYAWSKLITEDYGRALYPEGITSLRYFNVYGPHEDHKGKMASVGYQAYITDGDYKLFHKDPKRDFVYVKDVVSTNIVAMDSEPGIYN